MIEILAKKFIKDYENVQSPTVRTAYGTLCSTVGIVLNLLLCAGKMAAGLLSGIGITLNPMIAAAAMSLSSFCVVTNALRLNFFKLHDPSRDKKKKTKKEITIEIEKENEAMVRTMKIEGMMCPHCEARVKRTIEAINGVISADVSYSAGTAVVTVDTVTDDELRAAVEAQDYKVLGIE